MAGKSDDDDDLPDGRLGGYIDPPLDDCPVTFLGHHGKYVVFITPEGQIREEKPVDIARQLKVDIFNTAAGAAFLTNWRDDEDKFARESCAQWFVRQCRMRGVWDTTRPQRGLGVWPGRSGQAVLHRGEEIWTYPADPAEAVTIQSVAKAMAARTGPVYALKAAAPAPDEPADPEDGRWVREKLDTWVFEPIGSDGLTGADVIAGWTMCALLGAVPPFRPHVLLYGLQGSGKTTLIRFIHALLSSLAGDVIDDFTRAGLANDLGGVARPVLIDEAEASGDANGPGIIEEALQLIRRMATGKGATRKMGTIGGGSVTQTAIGAVLMGAINPVRLGPADASRMVELKLLPIETPSRPGAKPDGKIATDAEIERLIASAELLSPHLLGRALSQSRRYLADVAALKVAFRNYGQDQRGADLAAALAAGRCLLNFDQPLDADSAQDEAAIWFGLLEGRAEAEMVSNPGADCLAHLLGFGSGVHDHDRVVSIGELVAKWCKATLADIDGDHFYLPVLREFGLDCQMIPGDDGLLAPWLLVANNAPALSKIFKTTRWGEWRRTLAYLDGLGERFATRRSKTAHRFGLGVIQRATMVPLTPWLSDERNEPSGDRYRNVTAKALNNQENSDL